MPPSPTVRALVVAAATALLLPLSMPPLALVLRRLGRNALLGPVPPPPARLYPSCADAELVARVSVVVSVKDTCTQAPLFLAHLSTTVPRAMRVVYVYPNFEGCNRVDLAALAALLPRLRVLATPAASSPIAGFVAAQPLLETPYALLLHNDAYAMDPWALCELYRALEAHPRSAFAAPQLYERGDAGVVVPHGHHRNLHVRRRATAAAAADDVISYDIDFELLTRRLPRDFEGTEGPQLDFMEDHAYLARTDIYHLYMDPRASFTMEYIDNVLLMRANGTHPWYVPSARYVFDVDVRKLGWRDLPYFAWKRSERVGLDVRDHLAHKWRVAFPNSGIWNYVRHSMLQDLVLEDNALPDDRAGQCALFLAWFESIGFDAYDGLSLVDALHAPGVRSAAATACAGDVRLERRVARGAPAPLAGRRPPSARALLATMVGRKAINISVEAERIPIAYRLTDECDPARCGMLIVDAAAGCQCYTYAHRARPSRGIAERALDVLKLPSRTLRYARMQFATSAASATVACAADAPCAARVRIGAGARMLRWSWFATEASDV